MCQDGYYGLNTCNYTWICSCATRQCQTILEAFTLIPHSYLWGLPYTYFICIYHAYTSWHYKLYQVRFIFPMVNCEALTCAAHQVSIESISLHMHIQTCTHINNGPNQFLQFAFPFEHWGQCMVNLHGHYPFSPLILLLISPNILLHWKKA